MRRFATLRLSLPIGCALLGLLVATPLVRAVPDADLAQTDHGTGAAPAPGEPDFGAPPPAKPAAPAPPERPAAVDPDFPLPDGLRPAVGFWRRVYLEVTTDGGFLHDARRLGVVYEPVRFGGEKSRRRREAKVQERRRHWKRVLDRLRAGGEPRDDEERNVVHLIELALGHPPTSRDYSALSRRIRFQLGQRDKFRAGLIRSGAWEDAMRAAFRDAGLPEDLAYLPHVESSFNVEAYSKYGAAGVWQFMRSTGRRFMEVDYVVDERLDPMAATHAAVRLLAENHRRLKSWPLAITAYNHGSSGMARAKRRLGTDRIDVIVDRYQSRTFGFASRNFYAQFLAAREILRSYESYFGPVVRLGPEPVDEVTLPFYADVDAIERHLGVAPEVIRHYNRSLRPPVFRGAKRVPKGFSLRLPAGTTEGDPESWLAAMPAALRHGEQHRVNYYQVRRGDTLSRIAGRHRTSVSALAAANNLPSRHRIYPGQVLEIPDRNASAKRRRSLVKTAHAATKPAKPPAPPAKIVPVEGAPPSVSEDSPWRRVEEDRVLVDALETIGHFAEWLGVSASRLRKLNGLRHGSTLRMGQRIRLDFSRVSHEKFLERRMEFHKGIEEDFFGTWRVTGTVEHTLRRGESLWSVSERRYSVPVWLIHRFNPEVDLTSLTPGTALQIPVVEKIGSGG